MLNCQQKDDDKVWESLKAQVARMAQLKGFPWEKEAKRELVLALQCADSLDQAKAYVDGIIESATADAECPLPGDIRRSINSRKLPVLPDPACEKCAGGGWIIVERAGISAADRCGCWARREPVVLGYGMQPIDVSSASRALNIERGGMREALP